MLDKADAVKLYRQAAHDAARAMQTMVAENQLLRKRIERLEYEIECLNGELDGAYARAENPDPLDMKENRHATPSHLVRRDVV